VRKDVVNTGGLCPGGRLPKGVLEREPAIKLIMAQRSDLIGYVWSIVRDEHLAEDVFQDVLIVALAKLDTIADAAHLRRWLRVALRLESLKALRRQGKSATLMEPTLMDALDATWQAELEAEDEEMKRKLSYCVDRLPPKARLLIQKRYEEGITGKALALELGRSLNAVYVGLSRAHRALAECMQRPQPVGGEVPS